MAKLSPSEFAEKWARRTKAATQDMAKGIERVTESPGQKAAEKKDKWIKRLMEKETQDKWAQNVAAISLEEWKRRAKELGVQRVSAGVDKATNEMQEFAQQLLAYQESALQQIKNMPDVTKEDARARMNAWFDLMSKFRFKK